ncbi:MAG: hypothetical protein HKN45_09590 [Flavobacteriales bacterium]|nr:hypothetical protein [Flavobacteriales bacterium]
MEKVRMNGSGSPKLLIQSCSEDIRASLAHTEDLKYANVELRPGGVVIHFQTGLRVMALVIAYHHLSVYQNGNSWSFHGTGSFMKVRCMGNEVTLRNYLFKLMKLKNKHCGSSIDQGTGS